MGMSYGIGEGLEVAGCCCHKWIAVCANIHMSEAHVMFFFITSGRAWYMGEPHPSSFTGRRL